ncbi:hypothetical protein P691DRAFT_803191 [Macrolepiota fuliginosa MF-IS2]|uniref:F-box domain-containing protein n=1 Tax=Macrolepiota fuliginosa MF-IS2 TaxID=1400762 RepID=A0A9P6C2S2_9AGAR|nr:hypothetical protein P691DRAFT_803191 [Macrolepiota fuliginosa MF-IS2]
MNSTTSVQQTSLTDLPPEILGEIFNAYVTTPSESFLWEEGTVTSTPTGDSPMILGQICSYWRYVVLGMPSLWASICVEYPTPDHIELIRMWLDRAGSCPLDLVLHDWMDSGNRGCSEGTEAILGMFIETSRSWRSIDFVIELRHGSILDSLEWGACPALESASVCARFWDRTVLGSFWAKIHQSPVLRQVNWYRMFKDRLPSHAPWAQLQQIKTSSALSDEDVVFILQACPELASLDIYYTNSTPPPSPTLIIHDQLNTLILHLISDSTPLFNYVSFPSLRTFHITNEGGFVPRVGETVGEPIEAFLRRSQCILTDLEILDFDYNLDFLQHLLYVPATRNLDHFDLSSVRQDCDAIAKHPAKCVRDAACTMENEEFIQPRKSQVLEVVDLECPGDKCGFTSWRPSLSWPFGDDGMTAFQSHLAQLHLDD